MLAAWDCPVRLVDWTPAYIESARWDEAARCARILLNAGAAGATVSWSQRGAAASLTLDGRPLKAVRGKASAGWAPMHTRVPPGRHELVLQARD
jgi:hypothetical protein